MSDYNLILYLIIFITLQILNTYILYLNKSLANNSKINRFIRNRSLDTIHVFLRGENAPMFVVQLCAKMSGSCLLPCFWHWSYSELWTCLITPGKTSFMWKNSNYTYKVSIQKSFLFQIWMFFNQKWKKSKSAGFFFVRIRRAISGHFPTKSRQFLKIRVNSSTLGLNIRAERTFVDQKC